MDQIFELLAITLGAILANNFIFSQFLGICPFLGVSKKVDRYGYRCYLRYGPGFRRLLPG